VQEVHCDTECEDDLQSGCGQLRSGHVVFTVKIVSSSSGLSPHSTFLAYVPSRVSKNPTKLKDAVAMDPRPRIFFYLVCRKHVASFTQNPEERHVGRKTR